MLRAPMPAAAISRSYTANAGLRGEAVSSGIRLGLVIPTLCEAGNIRELLDRVREVLEPIRIAYEILVVDDDSCDGTGEVVREIAEQDPRVRLLVRCGERGLSGAILYGWNHTEADVLGVMDADFQHPPRLLRELLEAILDDRDLVIASRYTEGGAPCEWSRTRKLVSCVAVWAAWPLQHSGLRAKDPMSGYFMVRRKCLDEISFRTRGFKLLLEILVRGRVGSIQEIPFAFGTRYRGASKANLRVATDYAGLLLRLYASRLRSLTSRWRITPPGVRFRARNPFRRAGQV